MALTKMLPDLPYGIALNKLHNLELTFMLNSITEVHCHGALRIAVYCTNL